MKSDGTTMKATFILVVSCLLLATALAGSVTRRRSRRQASKGIITGPSNVAMVQGPSLTLQCRVEVTGSERIQWWEYGTNPNGALISDVNIILPGHPNNVRYALMIDMPTGQYDLYIYPTIVNDGTYYQCRDANSAPPATAQLGAQLVMIDDFPNCTTTLPPDGVVLEGSYYSAECLMYFKSSIGVEPMMSWTGTAPFTTVLTLTNTSIFSVITWTATRYMDAKMFTCKTNFTEKGFNSPDSANNVPTWTSSYRTQQMFVNWPPKNMYHSPDYPLYNIGTTVTCFADAFPQATYSWQNMATGEWFKSQSFTIREDMVGNQTMRCHAENMIQSIFYYNDYPVNILVKPKPSTPPPGVSTTTTAVPAEQYCDDLTGRWESTYPRAVMCIWVDYSNNGVLMGLLKNDTDTYYADIYGRTQLNTYDQGGFSVVWPGSLGISGHVFECKKCYGTEQMRVSNIKRNDATVPSCGEAGITETVDDYTFGRVVNSPPCTSAPPAFY